MSLTLIFSLTATCFCLLKKFACRCIRIPLCRRESFVPSLHFLEFDTLHGSVCFIVPLTKTEIHPHVSISYRTNSGTRILDEHGSVASISARFSDILRENYPHLCGNLSHLRISSLYILPYSRRKCNSFIKFFHLNLCRKKRNFTACICANATNHPCHPLPNRHFTP